jgi:hypothetical protein
MWNSTRGLDGNTKLHEAQKRHNVKLKVLQKEYQHLFE